MNSENLKTFHKIENYILRKILETSLIEKLHLFAPSNILDYNSE